MRTYAVVVIGVSGTGKSTTAKGLANAMGWIYVEGDDFHPPENIAKMRDGIPLTDEDRWPWLRSVRDFMHAATVRGESVVVACSALRRAYRDVLREGNDRVRMIQLTVHPDVIANRMDNRPGHFMPSGLLPSQLSALEPLEEDEEGVVIDAQESPEATLAATLAIVNELVRVGDDSVTEYEPPVWPPKAPDLAMAPAPQPTAAALAPPTSLTYESTSRLARTRAGRIHYHEAGDGAQTLVLLHGSGPGATGWSNYNLNIPVLATRFRVIAPDMPGWGESGPVTWQDRNHPMALAALMDELGLDSATIVGNSMGAGTAIRFAYEYPSRVRTLITMGASSGSSTLFGAGGLTEGIAALQQAYREPGFATMRRLVDVMTFDSSFATDDLIQQRADTVARHPEHNRHFLEGIGRRPVVEFDQAKISTIAAPTLLMHGRDDRVVHFEHSLRLVSLIPNSRLLLMNRCGHWLQIEHAQEFNRLVRQFVVAKDRP